MSRLGSFKKYVHSEEGRGVVQKRTKVYKGRGSLRRANVRLKKINAALISLIFSEKLFLRSLLYLVKTSKPYQSFFFQVTCYT